MIAGAGRSAAERRPGDGRATHKLHSVTNWRRPVGGAWSSYFAASNLPLIDSAPDSSNGDAEEETLKFYQIKSSITDFIKSSVTYLPLSVPIPSTPFLHELIVHVHRVNIVDIAT